jgi:hypothetical protein
MQYEKIIYNLFYKAVSNLVSISLNNTISE